MQVKSLMPLMLWLVLSGSGPHATAAASIFDANNRPAVRRFVVSAYDAYSLAIKQHGVAGLKKVAGPNFTLTLDGKTLQGKEAFAALEQPLNGLQSNVFYVSIPRVTLTKHMAVALTEETTGRKIDTETTVTTKRYWTQTWRKTPQGWELEKSSQRPAVVEGVDPGYAFSVGSHPDTPLTVDTTALGTDLGNPPASGRVLDLYGPYLDVLRHHDEAAFRSLLTPGFTMTDDGKVLSHRASLKLAGQIHEVFKELPRYYLTVNKLFVHMTRAAAVIEERCGGVGKDGDFSASYYWTQHWIMTPAGWRLDNITRTG